MERPGSCQSRCWLDSIRSVSIRPDDRRPLTCTHYGMACYYRNGFTVIEVLVAAGLVAATLVGLAHLVAVGAQRSAASRRSAGALAAAHGKLEELRAAPWTFASDGGRVNGVALSTSPPDSLDRDSVGFVDYLDAFGQTLPASSGEPELEFVRRWSINPLATGDLDTLILRVCVVSSAAARAASALPEACVATVRTRAS